MRTTGDASCAASSMAYLEKERKEIGKEKRRCFVIGILADCVTEESCSPRLASRKSFSASVDEQNLVSEFVWPAISHGLLPVYVRHIALTC